MIETAHLVYLVAGGAIAGLLWLLRKAYALGGEKVRFEGVREELGRHGARLDKAEAAHEVIDRRTVNLEASINEHGRRLDGVELRERRNTSWIGELRENRGEMRARLDSIHDDQEK